jgi:hypothetical protein
MLAAARLDLSITSGEGLENITVLDVVSCRAKPVRQADVVKWIVADAMERDRQKLTTSGMTALPSTS